MPRVTRRDCEAAVGRLTKMTGETLIIEYSGAPQRPRLAVYTDGRFDRWLSPRLRTGEFYEWVWAAIAGIELYWEKEATR